MGTPTKPIFSRKPLHLTLGSTFGSKDCVTSQKSSSSREVARARHPVEGGGGGEGLSYQKGPGCSSSRLGV